MWYGTYPAVTTDKKDREGVSSVDSCLFGCRVALDHLETHVGSFGAKGALRQIRMVLTKSSPSQHVRLIYQ
jgi:hypothetical protein